MEIMKNKIMKEVLRNVSISDRTISFVGAHNPERSGGMESCYQYQIISLAFFFFQFSSLEKALSSAANI